MKIAMIGAGAMGSLFGALLAEAGETVTLLDIRKDHVDSINANGLIIEDGYQRRTVKITATTDPDQIGIVDLSFVFVKSTHTADVVRTAAELSGSEGWVLTLQNGMGNIETLSERIDPLRIIAGTTSHGATLLAPGKIRHAGIGETVIGPWEKTIMFGAKIIAERFNQAGIITRTVADVQSMLWSKLFINVGINAITALTGISNGQLLDLEQTRQISREAVYEAVSVARAMGITIQEDPVEKTFLAATATAHNRSSMGQDVDKRRPTEIHAINGFIVRMAQQLGVQVPVNRTLTSLIETLEAHY
ncbi:2-dehydropantoate 2-reductase [Desulfosarcina widdelii]|uniref:2-dehydropantoate 2-reductase n=1 Tax=Desulfosarcina widdelii TaxID=947919 RepID=A0A5K7ZA50_9BACT|nr:2-dehydropantoate 2-reductase [Desulfosarcina widdelii]BBO77918.1 2-dehydropantoate 2-reductase [Desulfosarcina widdelii]